MINRRISPRQLMGRIGGRLLPRSRFQQQGPKSSHAVALTFDDGPDPIHTPRLLDALRDASVVATFFLIGEKVALHPEIVRRIVAEGHAIGGHTFTHPRPQQIDAAGLVAETIKTNELISKIVGRRTRMFRPPYGGLSIKKLIGLWRIGQTVVFWTIDPKDFACQTLDEVQANLFSQPLRSGAIILMHDTSAFAADLVPKIAADARRLGLTFTTPDAWNHPRP